MKQLKSLIAFTAVICTLSITACSNQQSTTEEKVQIDTMDSTVTKAKDASDKLEAQTKEVEASIEKMDKEFSTNK